MEFFSWETLATYAGALAATLAVTQLTKEISFIKKIPTQIFSYIVALVILEVAHVALGIWTPATGGLLVLNAVLVSIAANGGFEGIVAIKNAVAKAKGANPEDEDA